MPHPLPHTGTASVIINILHLSGTFDTTDEPILTYFNIITTQSL